MVVFFYKRAAIREIKYDSLSLRPCLTGYMDPGQFFTFLPCFMKILYELLLLSYWITLKIYLQTVYTFTIVNINIVSIFTVYVWLWRF